MSDKVPVYDENTEVIGHVAYNNKLDMWDGNNYTSGQTGRHLGYSRLKKSGRYVLIHGSQWQNERDYAVVCTARELLQAALRTDNISEVLATYPELQEVYNEIDSDDEEEIDTVNLEAEVAAFGNGAHIVIPKEHIGKKARVVIYG